MYKVSTIAVSIVLIYLTLVVSYNIYADNSEDIRYTLLIPKNKVLPFQPINTLTTLCNHGSNTIELTTSWISAVYFYYVGTSENWIQYNWGSGGKPPAPEKLILPPGMDVKTIGSYLSTYVSADGDVKHISESPGKVRIRAQIWKFMSGIVDVEVEEPKGKDAEAYKFLQGAGNNLTKYFYEGWWEPGDEKTISSMQNFIKSYSGSRYANLARLGLGLLYQRMAEPVFGEYPEGAEKALKNAKHTFKKLINEYKEKNGEKREQDKEEEDERFDDDNDGSGKKAEVDKNTFLWASYYLGQLYEEEAGKVSKNTEEAQENKEQELLKHALKVYVYALSQEPNEYYKFILTEAKTRVEGKLAQIEKEKKQDEEIKKRAEEMEKELEKTEKEQEELEKKGKK